MSCVAVPCPATAEGPCGPRNMSHWFLLCSECSPPLDTSTAHTCITFQLTQMSYSHRTCYSNHRLYSVPHPTLISCSTSPLTDSPDCLRIYWTICTYFLSLLFILCFHPLEDELQEGRIFFLLLCFLIFPVPRHCLTHNRDSVNMYWMNEWINKWMRSSRILKWTDRCPLVLSLPQHISANDLSQKYIDRLLSPVLLILCGQRVRFNCKLHGSLVEEMCSRLWLHVRVKWWPWLTLLPFRGYFLIVKGTHYP